MYCCIPKALYSHEGGLSSTTTSVQHPLGWCDGSHSTTVPVRSPHTSYRWRGERVIEPINWMGIIRRPWWSEASGGNLAGTPGLHPYSLRWVSWDTSSVRRKCYAPHRIVMLCCCVAVLRDETKTIKPIINEAFVASSGDIITDYNDLYCIFSRHVASRRVNISMSAFVIGETTNNKHYSTLLKTHV